jgi:hypothetical protein
VDRRYLGFLLDHLHAIEVESTDVVTIQLVQGHGMDEVGVLIALLGCTKFPTLLPMSMLFGNGDVQLRTCIITQGYLLERAVAKLLKEIKNINNKFAIIVMKWNEPVLNFPNLNYKPERLNLCSKCRMPRP